MTEEGRKKAIKEALEAFDPKTGETHGLTIRGQHRVLNVVDLRINIPVLNQHSHRIRAQLLEDPDYPLVLADPFSDAAQNVLTRLVQDRHRQFADLKASLRAEGQRDPGVITRSGLLINANTRLVALRELATPDRSTVRVMVLPSDISSSHQDVLEIETSLQVQRELKDPYSLVNELLLIEELAKGDDKVGRSHDEIATLMRYEGANSEVAKQRKAAGRQVADSLNILRMIRHLSALSTPKVPLTVFDAGESARERKQNLSEFCQQYDDFLKDDGLLEADRYAREWLFAFLAGAGAVHKARVIAPGWVDDFLVEELRDDERFGDVGVDALLAHTEPSVSGPSEAPSGLELLDDVTDPQPAEGAASALLNILAAVRAGATEVEVPGRGSMDAAEVKSIMTEAALGAIRAKSELDREERLAVAPIDNIAAARKNLRKASEAYLRVKESVDFERNKFQLALKRLRKDVDALDNRVRQDVDGSLK